MNFRHIKKYVHLNKWRVRKIYIFLEDYLYRRLHRDTKNIKILLTKQPKEVYQCQWASPHLVRDILTHKILASSDPHWQSFRFQTKKEYAFWSWRICAIACIKMVLNYYNIDKQKSMAGLTKDCLRLGGYDVQNDKGWFHRALIQYLRQKKLKASALVFFPWNQLIKSLTDNIILVVSISENKKNVNPFHEGHLVVILGAKVNKGIRGIYYLDPSLPSPPLNNYPSYVTWRDFSQVFLAKGIQVSQ